MERADAPAKTQRKRRLFFTAIASVAVLVIFVPAAIYFSVLSSRISDRITLIRAAGEPTSDEDLAHWHATRQGQNAADLYLAAFERASHDDRLTKNLPEFSDKAVPLSDEPPAAPLLSEYETYLAANHDALALLLRAARLSDCYYSIEVNTGPSPFRAHLRAAHNAAKTLEIDAKLNILKNHPDLAVDDLLADFRLADSLRHEPVILSQVFRSSILFRLLHELASLLSTPGTTDAQMQRLIEQVNATRGFNAQCHTLAMIGERAHGISSFDQPPIPTTNFEAKYPAWNALQYSLSGTGSRDHSDYLDLMAGLIAATKLPQPARRSALEAVRTRAAALPAEEVLSVMSIPLLVNVCFRIDQDDAALRVALVALAIQRHRLAHAGEPPQKLDDLVPAFLDAVPADPFDDKPLRYRLHANDYSIYSIGSNLIDDNGTPLDKNGHRLDISIKVRR